MIRWLVVLLALAGCEDSSRARDRGPVAHLAYRIAEPAAVDATVDVLRARLRELGLHDAVVKVRDRDTVTIDVRGLDRADYERVRKGLPRSSQLALRVAEPGTAYMNNLAYAIRTDAAAAAAGITAEDEVWDPYGDVYLRMADPAALAPWTTRFPPDPDHEIVLERVVPVTNVPSYYRTYYVERRVRLDGGDVADAAVVWDPQTNRPEVNLTFDGDGATRFSDLTAEMNGKKLAILVDGTVISAPVIQGRIAGGKARITMGAGTPDEQRAAADALVNSLRAGALPAAILEVDASFSDGT